MSTRKRGRGTEQDAEPKQGSAAPVPRQSTLPVLHEAARGCRACDLWERGTQTVFGEGAAKARVMLVGEQPGNEEDLSGHPFVGPAGRLLDKALAQAGIERGDVYVTNVVKHFKWEPRGKRRLHAKPNVREVKACMPWLQAEIAAVHPEVVVCLGATAAQALLGRNFRVTEQRGKPQRSEIAELVVATVHPSSILRAQTSEDRHRELEAFVADLVRIRKLLERSRRR